MDVILWYAVDSFNQMVILTNNTIGSGLHLYPLILLNLWIDGCPVRLHVKKKTLYGLRAADVAHEVYVRNPEKRNMTERHSVILYTKNLYGSWNDLTNRYITKDFGQWHEHI